jgi:predicted branched-subunit amino acid permease
MSRFHFFKAGFKALLPVTTGVIPFGAVMGTVSAAAGLSLFQTVAMNVFLYSGAAQLASVDLMSKHAGVAVVVATGLIINLRFLLYSAAMSPYLAGSGFLTKLFCAHTLTDQSYAVMSSKVDTFRGPADAVQFYCGTSVAMLIAWHSSVIAGYTFGNFAPASWSLEFGVPLSFLALVIPTLKNRKYVAVAVFSTLVSVLLTGMPYRLGLFVTALLAIALGTFLSRPKAVA